METGELISFYRKQSGMTIDELAAKSGVPKGTLNKIIAGITKAPTLDNMKSIARALGKTLADFDDEPEQDSYFSPSEQSIIKKYRVLDPYGKDTVSAVLDYEHKRCIAQEKERRAISAKPEKDAGNIIYLPALLQAASAGLGDFADDETAERIAVQQNKVTSKADCIIRVHGDSMEPKFLDGQQVLVRLQPAVELGEIGIFIRDGMRYIKIYRGSYLESANPNYGDTALEEYSKCIGKVLGVLEPGWVV